MSRFFMENSQLGHDQESEGEASNTKRGEFSYKHTNAFFNMDDIRCASKYLSDCVVSFLDKNDNAA